MLAPSITDLFTENFILVYFFYGLSFFVMGLSVLLELGHSSELDFAKALWPLAGFGLLHGSHEWLEMFLLIYQNVESEWISYIRLLLLAASFFMLLIFGARLIIGPSKRKPLIGMLLCLGMIWGAGLLIVGLRLPLNEKHFLAADVYTRYSLAIPGAALTTWGLLLQRRRFFQADMSSFGRDVTIAALAFGLYGFIGQLFTSSSSLFPSFILNSDKFLTWFGFPVQVFRAAMACLAAVFIIRSLRAFEYEASRRMEIIKKAQDAEQHRIEALRAELLHRTVQAQERERQRIARELHDETGQTLTAIGMGLRGMKVAMSSNPQRAIEQAQQLESLATSGILELQRLVSGLHPPHLDDLGLLAAIRWYANDISQRFNIPVQVYSQGLKPKLTSEMRVAIFRIAQEAITNVIRHANASQIVITIDYCEKEIKVSVSDDGQGFDVEQVLSKRKDDNPALGLLGIQERTALINGKCTIKSVKGEGTTIELIVPINREEQYA
jgi:signal transduction histidine kinase